MPVNPLNQIIYREFAPTTESIPNLSVSSNPNLSISSKDFSYRINQVVNYQISEEFWNEAARN